MISKQSTEEDKDCVRPDLSKLVKVREIGCRQRTITCRMLKNVKVLMVLSQSKKIEKPCTLKMIYITLHGKDPGPDVVAVSLLLVGQ